MQFYPIVYTRTNQTVYGLDFHYKARPRVLDEVWKECVSQLINEDNFPRMRRPRRLFVRTQSHLFWGIALYNQWFLPQEIRDRLEMEFFGDSVRGFWGGLLELDSLAPEEEQDALALIASCLVKNETVVNTSDIPQTPESLDLGLELPQRGLYSLQSFTEFPYACRLFRKYIELDWNNSNRLVYREDSERFPKSPVIADEPQDLTSLMERCDLMIFMNNKNQFLEERKNFINMIPSKTCNEESVIVQAVLAGKPCAVVTGIEKREHALRFPNELPSLNILVDEIQNPCEEARPSRDAAEPEEGSGPEISGWSGHSLRQNQWDSSSTHTESEDPTIESHESALRKILSLLEQIVSILSGRNRGTNSAKESSDELTSTPDPTPEDDVERFRTVFAKERPSRTRKECANDDLE